MRNRPSGIYEREDKAIYRYRDVALAALWESRDFGEDFDQDVADAFATVAQYLASIEVDEDFIIDRDVALGFLTLPRATPADPLIDTEDGQLVRLHRGDDGRVRAVTVQRGDHRGVTSTDLRFSFRPAQDFDADQRVASATATKSNLETSDDPGVIEWEAATQRRAVGIVGDDQYQRAASLYLRAVEAGYASSRRLIVDEMGVTYNYAGVLISRARDKGFLPATTDQSKGAK